VGLTQFGPVPLPSLVRENTKFMDITRLLHLLKSPEESKRVKQVLREFVRAEQKTNFFRQIIDELAGSECLLNSASESYTIRAPGATLQIDGDELVADSPAGKYFVQFTQDRNGTPVLSVSARRMKLTALPDSARKQLYVTVELQDAIVKAGNDQPTPRTVFPRAFTVPMSPDLLDLEKHDAAYYLNGGKVLPEQQRSLKRALIVLSNGILSETHARASFSLSCLILVLVGCALGMMFRSGNFLSAFAVSVVPALICIALIVTGQHTCENVPRDITKFQNTKDLGLALIWSGNVAVTVIAAVLLARLQRQ
jgi:hypothetical protein